MTAVSVGLGSMTDITMVFAFCICRIKVLSAEVLEDNTTCCPNVTREVTGRSIALEKKLPANELPTSTSTETNVGKPPTSPAGCSDGMKEEVTSLTVAEAGLSLHGRYRRSDGVVAAVDCGIVSNMSERISARVRALAHTRTSSTLPEK